MVILVAVLVGVAIGGIVYLRYFYGKDAPPPFELSSVAVLVPHARNRSAWRGRLLSLAALLFVATAPAAGAAVKAPVAGASCTKVGASAASGTTTLRCVVVNKKKRWTAVSTAVSSNAPTTVKGTAGESTRTTVPTTAPPSSSVEGAYKVGTGSAAGYRVKEFFIGGLAKVDAVGRSDALTGSVVLGRDGKSLQLQSVNVVVDTTKLKSDESKRDDQMKSIGLETNKFPAATFVSSAAVTLDADSESGKPVKATVSGRLTLHGVTRDVQVAVDAQLRSGTMEIVGRVDIAMKDYGIDPPEIADFVKADDNGALEFKLVLRKV